MSKELTPLEKHEESSESVQETRVKLDFSMNAIERLQKEVEFTDDEYKKVVGNFLIEEFKKDENLKMAYFDRKVTLDAIWAFILKEAKKAAKDTNSCVMSDKEVFGLAIHFVIDGEIKENKKDTLVLSKEVKKSLEEQAREEYLAEQKRKLAEQEKKRLEKEEAKRKAALEKDKKDREESGQMSLFDDWE